MIFIKYPKYVLFPSFGLTVCSYAFSLAATVCNLAPRSHLQFAIAKIQCPLVIICKHGQHHQCGWQKFLACNILGLHRKYLIVFNCTKNHISVMIKIMHIWTLCSSIPKNNSKKHKTQILAKNSRNVFRVLLFHKGGIKLTWNDAFGPFTSQC